MPASENRGRSRPRRPEVLGRLDGETGTVEPRSGGLRHLALTRRGPRFSRGLPQIAKAQKDTLVICDVQTIETGNTIGRRRLMQQALSNQLSSREVALCPCKPDLACERNQEIHWCLGLSGQPLGAVERCPCWLPKFQVCTGMADSVDGIRQAPLAVQLFFVGYGLPMMVWLGFYLASTDLRVCNAYSLASQVRAGQGLVALSAALGVVWVAGLLSR